MPEIRIYPSDHLAGKAAIHWVELAQESVARRGRFSAVLAGGSTPKATYAKLANPDFSQRVDWTRVHVFWGDERCVPAVHPNSNYFMAYETWLRHVPIPAENIHRLPGEMDPQTAAAEYETTLRAFFAGEAIPQFDLVLLGLGDDGHTASLFPGTAAIDERERWVIGQYVEKLAAWRLTLTPMAINGARDVTFLVSGLAKAPMLHQVLTAAYEPERLPAQVVRPAQGRVLWLVDEAAASQLSSDGKRSVPDFLPM